MSHASPPRTKETTGLQNAQRTCHGSASQLLRGLPLSSTAASPAPGASKEICGTSEAHEVRCELAMWRGVVNQDSTLTRCSLLMNGIPPQDWRCKAILEQEGLNESTAYMTCPPKKHASLLATLRIAPSYPTAGGCFFRHERSPCGQVPSHLALSGLASPRSVMTPKSAMTPRSPGAPRQREGTET